MTGPRVLVVEDEESYIEALTLGLTREGFQVEVARDGVAGLDAFHRTPPDAVLLDLMLPGMSGVEVCKQIRATSTVPIVMLTAKSTELDTVVGLEIGADDYVAKPYRMRELAARLRAVLRRGADVGTAPEPAPSDTNVVVDDVALDTDRHEVRLRGRPVPMPLREFEVLDLLMRNAGRALPRTLIIERLWGSDYVGDTKTLDVHIKRLRTKLEQDPARPARITTIRGVGYRYESS